MENKKEKKNNTSNIILVILTILLFLLGGFIVYDKCLKKEEPVKCPECESSKIDYSTANIDTKVKLVCTIDMKGLNEINIDDKCGEDFYYNNKSYQIRLKNLKYNDNNYTFTYILEKDTFNERDNDSGIVKMYIGSTLVDAHDGSYRNHFYSLKVDGNSLHIVENYPSDTQPYESNINLNKIIK